MRGSSAQSVPREPASARRSLPAVIASSNSSTSSSERVARGRPGQLVLTGLRGVGKTVLLNALVLKPSRACGAPANRGAPRPVVAASRGRRPPYGRPRDRTAPSRSRAGRRLPASSRRSLCATASQHEARSKSRQHRWQPGIDVPAALGRADSGTSRSTWSSCSSTPPTSRRMLVRGSLCSSMRCKDIPAADVSALCAACHDLSQAGAP